MDGISNRQIGRRAQRQVVSRVRVCRLLHRQRRASAGAERQVIGQVAVPGAGDDERDNCRKNVRYRCYALVDTILEQPVLPCPCSVSGAGVGKSQVRVDRDGAASRRRFQTPVVFATRQRAVVDNRRGAMLAAGGNIRAPDAEPCILLDSICRGNR